MGVRGMASFAGGFGKGLTEGLEQKRKREIEERRLKIEERRADLEAQRLGMENKKLEREEEMQRRLQGLNEEVKPQQMYIVDTPDGRMYHADEKLAQAVAETAGTQVQPSFVVGGQTFADKEAAQTAAEAANSPAARMRRRAEIYGSYGREDLANATMQNYKLTLDNNRREMQQAYLEARDKGVPAVLEMYNKRLPDGNKAEIIQGPQGPVLQLSAGGKVIGQKPFVEEQFFADMDRRIAATPDNLAELWRSDKQLGLQERQVKVAENTGAAQVSHLNAQTADIPAAAADRRTQAGASATSAGAAVTNANTGAFNATTNRAHVLAPTISAVPGQDGGLNFVTIPKQMDAQGNVSPGAPQVSPVKGLKHPGAYNADARNSLGLPGGMPGAPAAIDWNAAASVLGNLPPRGEGQPLGRGAPQGGVPLNLGQVPGSTVPPAPVDPRDPRLLNENQRGLYR